MENFDEPQNLERFGILVLADDELQNRLRAVANEADFIALAIRLGAERGLIFTAPTIVAALREKRRSLRERWL